MYDQSFDKRRAESVPEELERDVEASLVKKGPITPERGMNARPISRRGRERDKKGEEGRS
jgi:hypothetical protein